MKRFQLFTAVLLAGLLCAAAPGETAHNLLTQNNRTNAAYDLSIIPELLRSNANVFFVDNEATNASDQADGLHGETPDLPFKTYDFAVGRCTAGQNNIIVIMPYGIERYTTAGSVDVDVTGITTIGLGYGPARPKFVFDHADATFVVGRTGDGATFMNLTFQASVTAVTVGIQHEDGADNITWIDCEVLEGEAAVDEFVITYDVVVEANDLSFIRCRATSADAAGATSFLDIGDGVVTRLRMEDCVLYGDYATACVFSDQSNIACLFENTVMVNLNTDEFGIEFTGTGNRGVVRGCSFVTSGNYVDMGGLQDGGGNKTDVYAQDSDTISYGSFSLADGGITAAKIANDSIGATEIANDAIDATAIANDAIDATAVATDTIDADAVADDAIDAGAVAAGAIDAAALATDTITAAKIAADTITSSEIAASAIGADEIAADAIGASEIATGAITADELAADSITSSEIATDAIGAAEVADGAIDAGAIAADAITNAEIANDAIGATEIANAAIDAATFAASAITATVMATDSITSDELAATATAEIADAIADEAVSGHVTAGTVGAMLQPLHSGTASAGAAGTITLQNTASALADFYNGCVIQIIGGTGVGQSRVITDYAVTTFIANVTPNWITTPGATSVYVVYGNGPVRVEAITAGVITTAAFTASAIDATAVADAAIDAATFAAGAIAAAGIATNAVDADALATDAVTEIVTAVDAGNAYWQPRVSAVAADEVTQDLFAVAGGPIQILEFYGTVDVLIGAGVTTCKIINDATAGAAYDNEFSTAVAITDDAAGTLYVFTAANPSVLTPLTGGGAAGGTNFPLNWYCRVGMIEQTMSADPGGAAGDHITWYMVWRPLAAGVTVTAQ